MSIDNSQESESANLQLKLVADIFDKEFQNLFQNALDAITKDKPENPLEIIGNFLINNGQMDEKALQNSKNDRYQKTTLTQYYDITIKNILFQGLKDYMNLKDKTKKPQIYIGEYLLEQSKKQQANQQQ